MENWPMALTLKNTQSDRPFLSPSQAVDYTGGAVTYQFLKRDRVDADANGTAPAIPYYRIGYRTLRYRPSDLDAFLESQRVG